MTQPGRFIPIDKALRTIMQRNAAIAVKSAASPKFSVELIDQTVKSQRMFRITNALIVLAIGTMFPSLVSGVSGTPVAKMGYRLSQPERLAFDALVQRNADVHMTGDDAVAIDYRIFVAGAQAIIDDDEKNWMPSPRRGGNVLTTGAIDRVELKDGVAELFLRTHPYPLKLIFQQPVAATLSSGATISAFCVLKTGRLLTKCRPAEVYRQSVVNTLTRDGLKFAQGDAGAPVGAANLLFMSVVMARRPGAEKECAGRWGDCFDRLLQDIRAPEVQLLVRTVKADLKKQGAAMQILGD